MSAKFHLNNVSLSVRKIKRLTALKIGSLKQPGRYADGNGLELQIGKTGSKSWLLRYALNGHEHRMGLGSLKDFNLAEARERSRQARQLLADGKDPLSIKRAAKLEAMRMLTFSECAEAFMSVKLSGFRNGACILRMSIRQASGLSVIPACSRRALPWLGIRRFTTLRWTHTRISRSVRFSGGRPAPRLRWLRNTRKHSRNIPTRPLAT